MGRDMGPRRRRFEVSNCHDVVRRTSADNYCDDNYLISSTRVDVTHINKHLPVKTHIFADLQAVRLCVGGDRSTSSMDSFDLASLVLNVLFGVAASYLLISLAFYQYKSFRRHPYGDSDLATKNGHLLRIFCLIAAAFACLHFWSVVLGYSVADSDDKCYAFGVLWLITYALGVLTSYIFLWFRQYIITNNPSMPYLRNKKIVALSYATLSILVVGAVMIFLAGSRLIFFSSCTTNSDQAKMKLYTTILSGILLSLTVIGQMQLLALFIIPIVKHRRAVNSNVEAQSGGSMDIVTRCIIAAVVCTVSDVAAAVVTIVIESSVGQLVYDLNLLVNVTCCLASFQNWRKMLNPCKYGKVLKKIARPKEVSVNTTEVTTS